MPRGFSAMTVLRNKETSKVLFAMMRSGETVFPMDLAKALKKSYPTIRGHLERLEKVRIVTMGEKEGKYRHYVIDWERFSEIVIERYETNEDSMINHVLVCPLVLEKPPKYEVKKVFRRLNGNPFFINLIKNYFCGIAERQVQVPDTIDETLDLFEEDLSDSTSLQHTAPGKDAILALKEWALYNRRHFEAYQKVFEKALESTLLKKQE